MGAHTETAAVTDLLFEADPDIVPAVFQQKIAYISDQQYPIEKADSEQVINTVSALAAEGMDIRLVIPRDWRSFGMPKQLRKRILTDFYSIDYAYALKELSTLPLTRFRLEKYSHCVVAPLWAKYSGHQIVYTRNYLPAFVSLSLGLKVLFETYRDYSGRSLAAGRLLARHSQHPNFLGIITHSKLSKQSLLKLGIDQQKVEVIHNGFNPEVFTPFFSKHVARQRLHMGEKMKIACYAGRLDKEKGIVSLIEMAEKTPEITYFFIGKSQKDPHDWIDKMAEAKGLRNIRRIPWMKSRQLTRYLLASDVLLIPPTAEPLTRFGKTVLPLKLFLYMAAARPILAPALADVQDILTSENAMLVEPDNADAACDAIRTLFSNEGLADELSHAAKSASSNYTWRRRAKNIIAFIQSCLSEFDRSETEKSY